MCEYVKGRGAQMIFFDTVRVNGREAAPIYNFLKQASGDARPIEWNFVKARRCLHTHVNPAAAIHSSPVH